jgi:hypothetical protein
MKDKHPLKKDFLPPSVTRSDEEPIRRGRLAVFSFSLSTRLGAPGPDAWNRTQ